MLRSTQTPVPGTGVAAWPCPRRHHGYGARGLSQQGPKHVPPLGAGPPAHHDQRGARRTVEQGLRRREQDDVLEHWYLRMFLTPRPQRIGELLHLLVLPGGPVLLRYGEGQFGGTGGKRPGVDNVQA